jgi:hypothetical protein
MLNNLFLFLALSTAYAEEPTFTIVSEGQPAPFEGVLLSPSAAAEILASQTEQEEKCDLEIEYELDKAGTECELQKELIEIRVQTCEEARDIENTQKDLQIEELQKTIKKQSRQYKWLWFAGGAIVGGATFYAIQQTAVQ